MTDRAVSNTLGFVLLFAVIFASVTAVATLGFDSLNTARDATVEMNAELSMEGLADSASDLNTHNLSARTSVFRMGSGSLDSADTAEVTVTVDHDGSSEDVVDEAEFHPVRYRFQDTELIYSLGAVFQIQDDEGQRVVKEPNFLLKDESVIIPVLVTKTDEPGRSVGGSTAVVYFQRTERELVEHIPDTGATEDADVTIEIDSTEAQAQLWHDILDPKIGCDPLGGGDTEVTCTHNTDDGAAVIVRQTDVNYEFAA